MSEVRILLQKELEQELRDLYLQDPNSEGYSAATERFAKLYKLKIDEDQAQGEIDLKVKQLGEGKVDRWVKVVVDAAGIVVPAGIYWVLYNRGLKFEQTGTFTSTTLRGLLGKLRLTK